MQNAIDENTIFITIGNNFHAIRNALKKTLEGVASDLEITHPVLSKIENGRYPGLSLTLLVKLCNYYDISLQQVLEIESTHIFNYSQNNHPGNHTQNNQISKGYETAISAYESQVFYFKEQNQKLIDTIIDLQTKKVFP